MILLTYDLLLFSGLVIIALEILPDGVWEDFRDNRLYITALDDNNQPQ